MPEPRVVVSALVVDCHDPDTLAAFWYELLGGELMVWPQYGVVALRAPGVTIDFTLVPDDKTTKNRLHLDLATDDPATTVAHAISFGATHVRDHDEFTVLQDPEGNEFCVLFKANPEAPWAPPN